MSKPILFVVFCEKTAFFKLEDVFGECYLYREKSPQIEPVVCLREENSCYAGKSCMATLAQRVFVLFEEVLPAAYLMLLYYRKRNLGGIGAACFWRDMREPNVITVNPYAWNMVKTRGNVFRFSPGPSFFLTGMAAPPELDPEIDAKSEDLALD
jgi:hypothetical protein